MNFEKIPQLSSDQTNLKNKSISLPKIKTNHSDNSSPPKKTFKEIHKVKWSIAPKCLIPAH